MADIANEMNTLILNLRAQVAHLEAANEQLAAALREMEWCGIGGVYCPACDQYKSKGHRDRCAVAAALSPTAGEGWLEVREQVREALKQARCELYGIEPVKPYCTIAQCDAALDALKGGK